LIRAGAVLAIVALSLAACQTAPPAAEGKPATYGDWTVKTSGYVRAETAVVK